MKRTGLCQNPRLDKIIRFGRYPQTRDGTDQTPIAWRVMRASGSHLLLLSELILECKRYHGHSPDVTWRDCVDITWRECDLRAWLNGCFRETAFTSDERRAIVTTLCTDNGSSDTEDDIFLLSVTEVTSLSAICGSTLRRAVGTDYAALPKPDGCHLYVYDKTNKDNYLLHEGNLTGCSWWWLRTQGNKPSRAFFVGTGGSIRSYANVSLARDGVRPALVVDMRHLPQEPQDPI